MSNAENVPPGAADGAGEAAGGGAADGGGGGVGAAALWRELRRVAAAPPAGVVLALRDDDITDVVATIEGPVDTPYAGGSFRVRLQLTQFPAKPPRATFLTRIFHPNVSPTTGEVCVSTLHGEWRASLGLAHVLVALRCLLVAPNADSALNAEAGRLLRARYDDYAARARMLTDIHARPVQKECGEGCAGEPSGKRRAAGAGQRAGQGAGQGAGQRGHDKKRRILKRL